MEISEEWDLKLHFRKLKTQQRTVNHHTGPSFNTGTENTIQISKFKRIGFENMADFNGGE